MWLRKNKPEAEQGRPPGRQVDRAGGPPAFSYYTNQSSDAPRNRLQSRTEPQEGERPKRRLGSRVYVWLTITLAVVCLGKITLLGTSPKIIVVGSASVANTYTQADTVYAAAAQKILGGSIANRSKLTVDLNGTARALERQFPELQAVSLGVPLVGNRPVVYVQVARPSLVVQTGSDLYALNKSGIVLAKVDSQPTDIPLIVDQSGNRPRPGKQFLPSSTVTFLQTVVFQLAQAHLDVSVFALPREAPYELDVRLDGKGYYLRFNLQADALTQSGAAIAALQHLNGAEPATYLDVRVPGRVYYK